VEQLVGLKYIGVLATGYNVVDVEAARERQIVVTNVPGYASHSVAQMAFAHVLHLAHHVASHAQQVREGRWSQCPDFCYWDFPQMELDGKTMGIVGLGRIGRAVARFALAFGMRVLANTPRASDLPADVQLVDLDTLFRESDVVSLHCPLTEQTQKMIHRDRLALMKPNAYLINTSRGPLVDEQALADALNAGQIAGAGLDVLSVEPPLQDNPLLTAKNCYVTPHIGWASREARQRLMHIAVENVAAFLAGKPRNLVT
jgi:glycerate dehydrogenase